MLTDNTSRTYDIVTESNVMAPMRDGTRLAADVHRPATDEPFPALLVRTPYDKVSAAERYLPFVPQAGYALVVQDVRGRFASEGVFEHDQNDGWGKVQDGYDSVEWVAQQPWCNGKVAVGGLSAPGCAAMLLMPTQPPHLSAGFLEVCGGVIDNYLYRYYHGGVFRYRVLDFLLLMIGPDIVAKELDDPVQREEVLAQLAALKTDPDKMMDAYFSLPLDPPTIVGDLNLPGLAFWHDYLTNQTRNHYWKSFSTRAHIPRVNVPSMHVTGWFDVMLQGALDAYTQTQEAGGAGARGRQRLLVGPWTHSPLWATRAGELDFPNADMQDGRAAFTVNYLDMVLKDADNAMSTEPPILLYVMGDNVWRAEKEWPLARTQYQAYYLRDGVGGSPIDSLNGNKLLSMDPPTGDEPPDRYDYDPANPVMTVGGRTFDGKGGATDQRTAERKSITFTTPPLEQDTEVTGPLKAVLYAASSATDTDWFVKLTDVHPDGRSLFVAHGLLRARLRNSMEEESLIEPGKVYRYEIDLWSTSQVFKRGHCIRVTVTSSDFPAYARNLNTGADNNTTCEMQIARQEIFHDAGRPSHILLPVIPRV